MNDYGYWLLVVIVDYSIMKENRHQHTQRVKRVC